MISVISVVKGRYDITEKSFQSIWNNCDNENDIEHLVMYDFNDIEMKNFLTKYYKDSMDLRRNVTCNYVQFKDKTEYKLRNMHRDYWNKLASMTKGDIVIGLCNDMLIDTKSYDSIIKSAVIEHMRAYQHSYFQILFDDDFDEPHDYSPCIALTRPCLEVFHGIAPPEISSQGADQYVNAIFKRTDMPSIIDLRRFIKIKEYCVQNGSYPSDSVQEERPLCDQKRAKWKYNYELLYKKNYYYHKLNNRILQQIIKGASNG